MESRVELSARIRRDARVKGSSIRYLAGERRLPENGPAGTGGCGTTGAQGSCPGGPEAGPSTVWSTGHYHRALRQTHRHQRPEIAADPHGLPASGRSWTPSSPASGISRWLLWRGALPDRVARKPVAFSGADEWFRHRPAARLATRKAQRLQRGSVAGAAFDQSRRFRFRPRGWTR